MRTLMQGEGGAVDSLILDLLAFVAREERTYEDVIEAWRTSCPRLPVWEETNARELIARERINGRTIIRLTDAGRTLLLASA